MRKIVVIVMVLAMFAVSAVAQNSKLEKFFDKYNKQEGITLVNVNGNFQVNDEGSQVTDIQGVRILTRDNEAKISKADFHKEAIAAIVDDGFVEMLTVQGDDGDVNMYIQEDKEGKTTASVLAVTESDEAVVIWIEGAMDFARMANMMGNFDMDVSIDSFDVNTEDSE